MTAQPAAQTQTGRTCGDCRVVTGTKLEIEVSLSAAEGDNDAPLVIKYQLVLCPLHAQAEDTARERDGLLEALENLSAALTWNRPPWPLLIIEEGRKARIDAAYEQACTVIAAATGGAG